MKKFFIFATALAALASCSSDDFVGESPNGVNGQIDGAISFNLNVPTVTRAENTGKTAADNLSDQFIVYGEKGETSDGKIAADGKLVYKNYLVKWVDNSAYTTTSNTKGWEYVGITATTNEIANISPNSGSEAQTIKYWDYSAGNYTFTAVSALPADIENGRVKIDKITSEETGNKVYDKGYIIKLDKTGTAEPYTYATFDKLYFSDRQVVSSGNGTDRNATNAYGGNVTLTFRNALSQIRAGIYETIPGYAISDIQFYVTSDNLAQVSSTDAFGAICPNIKTTGYTEALKVTYENSGTTENHPIVKPVTKDNTATAVTPTADLILGTNISTVSASTNLGTTAAEPTWDTSGGTYTPVFPQVDNSTNLKLKCNYTLYNSISKETIVVEGATAEVPAKYLQWKPNYKYTYLFKISDNTNGSTGQGVVGLYPITFDAIEIVNGDGLAEYITTVSEPSITTFGVDASGKYVASHGTAEPYYDYPATTDVYATIMDGSTVITPVFGTNVNLYKSITATGGFLITEASLAEAIAETGGSAGEKISYVLDNSIGAIRSGTENNGIPAEDGTEITGVPAVKLANLAAGTYAIEYIRAETFTATGNTYTEEAFNAAKPLYTTEQCTVEATWGDSSTTYYKKNVTKPGIKIYKIITVK